MARIAAVRRGRVPFRYRSPGRAERGVRCCRCRCQHPPHRRAAAIRGRDGADWRPAAPRSRSPHVVWADLERCLPAAASATGGRNA